MPSSMLGLNMRVTGHFAQGGRKYMEDVFSVAYQQSEDGEDLEYAFIGIFDGHGGKEAALFAKENLMDNISKQSAFWSDNDELVLKAIKEGFLKTQQDMWADIENWPKTGSGMPSTAGTTASIAFIRRSKLYVGHVGDSGIVMGEQCEYNTEEWRARRLTRDHKPDCDIELARIESSGGKVVNKSGVPRVVWTRPQKGHTGPVRRSTHLDEVPFLAVARALGDLWSYNSKKDEFIVSPEPDCHVYDIDISKHRCLVFGTDGAWNVMSPEGAIAQVKEIEKNNENYMLDPGAGHTWKNPAKHLVESALGRWRIHEMRADNTTIVVVLLDPPGPPRAQVLRRQREMAQGGAAVAKKPCNNGNAPPLPPKPAGSSKGISVISRFPNAKEKKDVIGRNLMSKKAPCDTAAAADKTAENDNKCYRIVHDSQSNQPKKVLVDETARPASSSSNSSSNSQQSASPNSKTSTKNVQINEVSSSDNESSDKVTSSNNPTTSNKTTEEASKAEPATGGGVATPNVGAGRKSLSRELAGLKLESPAALGGGRSSRRSATATPTPNTKQQGGATGGRNKKKFGRRSIEGLGHEDSDEENDGGVPAAGTTAGSSAPAATGGLNGEEEEMVPASKLREVERKYEVLSKKLQEMEDKVSKKTDQLAQQVNALKTAESTKSPPPPALPAKSTAAPPQASDNSSTPSRILRSRNRDSPTSVVTPSSAVKRKHSQRGGDAAAVKTVAAVSNNRSRSSSLTQAPPAAKRDRKSAVAASTAAISKSVEKVKVSGSASRMSTRRSVGGGGPSAKITMSGGKLRRRKII